ncbi:MAG: hypothetical protein UX17_C0074G0007 [Parcubacteria group bacterium GW2011_GWC2_45_7]|nr:MAG: hypothetical protein UX17_C0074G0007 [Parcubacteria group bacterium GW2011_GWC2_45_7]KKU73120.1 MAG: hypothetical protein UX98_C0011G0007 [Parcubacteria group bacterium GW2011_GWA2_47_26]
MAVLRFHAKGGSASGGEGEQELVVPKEELPKDVKEGASLFLLISESKSEEEAREKLAKTILNEILNTEV